MKNIVKELFKGYMDPLSRTLKEDKGELKKSGQYMSDGFDKQLNAINNILREIKQLKEENNFLKQEVEMLENRLNNTEQKESVKNLVVTGIKKTRNNSSKNHYET
ncbi:unnamed protein product [Brassicogethes aeneus]|uniref:Uncharacterized protein n=1 Tax=Brassicogethes aeneus TaxID=1431903 RepID=A0A9P0AT12_BRAAE|nr:unnamed protein product [Brassicogethes aeneus]